jgi:hypothetical protein
MFHKTMLHRVEVRVVQASGKVSIIADRVLPVPPRQMPRSPRRVMAGDRHSRGGKAFENAVLIARQRPGKSASPVGKVHRKCTVGKDDPGVDVERRVAPHLPNSVPQRLNLRHQQVWATVEQVDREEERSTRNPIAAIVRHAREYALENGAMRSLWQQFRRLCRSRRRWRCRPAHGVAPKQIIYSKIGAQTEGAQEAAGHHDPSATKLYDRRGYNPAKAARFFATYRWPRAGSGEHSDF